MLFFLKKVAKHIELAQLQAIIIPNVRNFGSNLEPRKLGEIHKIYFSLYCDFEKQLLKKINCFSAHFS